MPSCSREENVCMSEGEAQGERVGGVRESPWGGVEKVRERPEGRRGTHTTHPTVRLAVVPAVIENKERYG